MAVDVHDPLGQPVGLSRAPSEDRDAACASTAGTGELIMAEVAAGAWIVPLGVGGSATIDGGSGALEAIA